MSVDALITRDGPVAVPMEYVVPAASEIIALAISATFADPSNAGPYVPAMILVTPQGQQLGPYPLDQQIAAGASARVSWFPHVGFNAAAAAQLPTTETLFVDTRSSAGTPSTTVLESGVSYLVSCQGTYSIFNTPLGVGTPEQEAMYPSSGGLARLSTEVGFDPECCFATSLPYNPPPAIGHVTYFQMDLGSGFQHIEPFDGQHATPAADHFYSYQVTGQGTAATFKMADPGGIADYADNYGLLKVAIYAIPGGGSQLAATDGVTTVQNVTELAATSGLSVTAAGTTADLAVIKTADGGSA